MESIGTRSGSPLTMTAGGGGLVVLTGVGGGSATAVLVGRLGRREESPLPSALRGLSGSLVTFQYLLCELDVTFGGPGPYIIQNNRLTVTRGLSQADAAGDNGLENFVFE